MTLKSIKFFIISNVLGLLLSEDRKKFYIYSKISDCTFFYTRNSPFIINRDYTKIMNEFQKLGIISKL